MKRVVYYVDGERTVRTTVKCRVSVCKHNKKGYCQLGKIEIGSHFRCESYE